MVARILSIANQSTHLLLTSTQSEGNYNPHFKGDENEP